MKFLLSLFFGEGYAPKRCTKCLCRTFKQEKASRPPYMSQDDFVIWKCTRCDCEAGVLDTHDSTWDDFQYSWTKIKLYWILFISVCSVSFYVLTSFIPFCLRG